MYGIPIEPARMLLKYSVITESKTFNTLPDTKLIYVCGAGGACGGAGGGIPGTEGSNGGLGGDSSFGPYTFYANNFVGLATGLGSRGLTTQLSMALNDDIGGIRCGEAGVSISYGGAGGDSLFGSGGSRGAPTPGIAGTCGGGAGGSSAGAGGSSGGGAASSALGDIIPITDIKPSYTVTIGAGGVGGAFQSGASQGGAGGSGIVLVWEYS